MKTFKDRQGREWTLAVTIGSVLRVKNLLGVDLLDMTSGVPDDVPTLLDKTAGGKPVPLATMLTLDLALVGNVVYHLVKPKADELGVAVDAFVDLFDGELACEVQRLLLEELTDFFRQAKREWGAKVLAKAMEALTAGMDVLDRRIDRFDVRKLVDQLEQDLISGDSSSSWPASSAATRADSPSAS